MIDLIELNGKKTEYYINGNSDKIILIFPGMEGNIYDWLDIAEEISKNFTVILIHRQGVGKSEFINAYEGVLTACRQAYLLLEKLNIKNKIILLGHSYGGLCVQYFAKLHPEKVESAILVESTSIYVRELDKNDVFLRDNKEWLNLCKKYSNSTKDELRKELNPNLSNKQLLLPKYIQTELLDFYIRPELYKEEYLEILDLDNVTKFNDLSAFPDITLKILVRDATYSINEMIKEEGLNESEANYIENIWQTASKKLLSLSTKSSMELIENCGHLINEDNPDAIINAIYSLV